MKNNKLKFFAFILCLFIFLFSFNLVLATDKSYGLNATVGVNDSLKQAFSVEAVDANSGKFISSRLGILIGAILSFIGVIFSAFI